MKKALVIANMLFAPSAVFGMNNNLLPVDFGQSSDGMRQVEQNPDVEKKKFKEVINNADLLSGPDFLEYRQQEFPLHYAVENGYVTIVKYLVEKRRADVNEKDRRGRTPLFAAAEENNIETVKYLVEHGADVNKKNKFGETPLFDACGFGYIDLVKYLVEHGADVNEGNKVGSTPLLIATVNGNTEVIEYLLEHGANANTEYDIPTILSIAEQIKRTECYKLNV